MLKLEGFVLSQPQRKSPAGAGLFCIYCLLNRIA